ncbi:MAG: DUF448 domain-containing protein [Steroidobacteraceae bacterium]|nr:DUF448 domain-containing protein [Deltaproteobacteria bacterium]
MARHGNAEQPQRSCLGCRTARNKDLLIRFVLSPEIEVLPDLDSRLPGRGAYTCLSSSCLTKAITQNQFKRSYKQDVSVMSAEALVEHVRQQLHDRIIGLIGLANKAGNVTGGGSMVSDALRGKAKPGLVLLATDISEPIGAKIVFLADVNHVPNRTIMTKDDFGAILGKAPRSAIAVKHGGFVAQLLKAIDRYRNFLGEV